MKNNVETLFLENKLISRIGGGIAYTVDGKRIKNDIENTLRKILTSESCEEVEFPLLIDYGLLQGTAPREIIIGRQYNCIKAHAKNKDTFLLARTAEELAATFYAEEKYDEPWVGFQIKTKFRDEAESELGFLKRREFTMLDIYSFDNSLDSLKETYKKLRNTFKKIFNKLEIPYEIQVKKENCVIDSEEFICTLESLKGVEIGDIYSFGDFYSLPFEDKVFYTSSYGLGIDRLFAAVVLSAYEKGTIRDLLSPLDH